MANKISICPHCNNYVEGKRKSSTQRTVTRTISKALVKDGSRDIVTMGSTTAGALTGAAIGSVVPVIGTTIGAGIGAIAGYVGKALANDAIGKKVDQAADYFEDEYTEVVYHYSCPKCGYSWNSTSSNTSYSNSSSRTAILHLLSECSNIKSLNEGCSLSFAGISYSKLKQALYSTYKVNLFEYELNSCKNVRQLIELIENRMSLVPTNSGQNSSRTAILHLLSECSNIKSLNEGCSLSFAGISYSKLKQALYSTYKVNLFEYELNSCKNVRQLIELIENRMS